MRFDEEMHILKLNSPCRSNILILLFEIPRHFTFLPKQLAQFS